jgi:hypothetical protein
LVWNISFILSEFRFSIFPETHLLHSRRRKEIRESSVYYKISAPEVGYSACNIWLSAPGIQHYTYNIWKSERDILLVISEYLLTTYAFMLIILGYVLPK